MSGEVDVTMHRGEDALERDLNSKLHGQHLVIHAVHKAERGHVNDKNPPKALVLSFNGCSGGGKNFVTRLIVNNMYSEGENSAFVHYIHAEIHSKHASKVDIYKDQLHSWIFGNVSACGRSIFVFDEMENMPEGLIDALVPFLDYHSQVDKEDFRRSIFIFLSNIGGYHINEAALQQWQSGKPRESMMLRDVQEILHMSVYNLENGLAKSKVVSNNLIDHFIPFLPLERSHVQNCIIDEFKRQNLKYDEDDIANVLNELIWVPKNINLFSASGCRKVAAKISLHFYHL